MVSWPGLGDEGFHPPIPSSRHRKGLFDFASHRAVGAQPPMGDHSHRATAPFAQPARSRPHSRR